MSRRLCAEAFVGPVGFGFITFLSISVQVLKQIINRLLSNINFTSIKQKLVCPVKIQEQTEKYCLLSLVRGSSL